MTICKNKKCNKRANFGNSEIQKAEYCVEHKQHNYIDVTHNTCKNKNCVKRPSYGKAGSTVSAYCADHKPYHYIDVTHNTCKNQNCTKIASYGKAGSRVAVYCTEHKLAGYIDVKNKTCKDPNCTKLPVYGKAGSKLAEYCTEHKLAGYIDVKSKTCKEPNCATQPAYGKAGSKLAVYCAKHKLDGYINVKDKICKEPNCTTLPSYGKAGSKLAVYCAKHKLDGYINVKSKKCTAENCTTQPSYGVPGYSPEFCASHKTNKHIKNPLKYKDGIITCNICDAKVHYSNEYCTGCQKYLLEGITAKRKNKELSIKLLLEENTIEFEHDRQIKNGQSRKRPDFHIPTKWGSIIIEVDEFQHIRNSYSCKCEISRMKQIYFDISKESPLLFVRYNPDKYKHVTGEKNYTGKWRKEYLIKYIKEMMVTKPVCDLGVVYLFYDGFLSSEPEIEVIEPYK